METNNLTIILLSVLLLIVLSFFGYTRITGFATYQYGTTTMNATVGAWVAITPSSTITAGISFGNINPGTNNNTALNDTTGPPVNCTGYNISIDTSSNVNVDLYNDALGDLTSGGNTIGIKNVTLEANQTNCGRNVNITLTSGGSVQLNTTYLIMGNYSNTTGPCGNVAAGNACHISYWLNVPSSQVTGTYSTTYKYCGVQQTIGVGSCG